MNTSTIDMIISNRQRLAEMKSLPIMITDPIERKICNNQLIYFNLELQMEIAYNNRSKELYKLLLDRFLQVVNCIIEFHHELVLEGKVSENDYICICNNYKEVIDNHNKILKQLDIKPTQLLGNYIHRVIRSHNTGENVDLYEELWDVYHKLITYIRDNPNQRDIGQDCINIISDMINSMNEDVQVIYSRDKRLVLNNIRYGDL